MGSDPAGDRSEWRLFVAVWLPEGANAAIERAIEPWRERIAGVRWTPPELRHVTLCFLGGVPPGDVAWVRARLAEAGAAHAPFETAVDGLGAFPPTGRARVLWAGLDDPERRLEGLALAVGLALAPRFPVPERPFRAHVTTGRARGARLPAGFRRTAVRGEPFGVDGIDLVRSHVGGPGHARYERLARIALSGRPAG